MSTSTIRCNVCGMESLPLANAVILDKYNIQYYSCGHCGFIQTESPFWLEEAYSSAIARSDIGLVGRNIKLADFCSALIPMLPARDSTFLDYGGGNGMFVRMMRDRGFDFYWYDKYSSNQFAEGFEMLEGKKFSVVTAFEVFEHLPQPLDAIREMLRHADTLIFTTRLLPRWGVLPEQWWYFTLDTGQHISLYSRESLKLIAERFDLKFSSNGISIHILSARSIPDIFLKALSFPPFAMIFSRVINLGRRSLLAQDYFRLTGKKLVQ